jgi:hypothetical protein
VPHVLRYIEAFGLQSSLKNNDFSM